MRRAGHRTGTLAACGPTFAAERARSGVSVGIVAFAAAFAVTGCDYLPFGYTTVQEITETPAAFEGKEIRIKGKADNATSLMGFRAFMLRDATGEILVVTEAELPAAGDTVAVKGQVRSAMIIGGKSVGLRVEETKRLR